MRVPPVKDLDFVYCMTYNLEQGLC